jgi:hypothetical protein
VTSPNVQIIAMPLPFSDRPRMCAFTGTGDAEERRQVTSVAEQRLGARQSSGGATRRDARRGFSSGRVGFDLDRSLKSRTVANADAV